MFGRQVALALRVRTPRCISSQSTTSELSRILVCRAVRQYATPGRPRTAVGEPSKPVKRAVKRAAREPTTTTVGANGTTEEAATSKTKRKSTASATKKAAPKKKAVKELTPEQEQIKAEQAKIRAEKDKVQAEKAQIAQWKKIALNPPHIYMGSAFLTFASERVRELYSDKTYSGTVLQRSKEIADANSAMWRAMTPAEIEHWNHIYRTRKETSIAEYKAWVEAHTTAQIKAANNARNALNRKFPAAKSSPSNWPRIQDGRQAKRPRSPYMQFSLERNASGDFANIRIPDRSRLIGKEWNAMTNAEKEKYKDLHRQDLHRYVIQHTDVYGTPPPYAPDGRQPIAATA